MTTHWRGRLAYQAVNPSPWPRRLGWIAGIAAVVVIVAILAGCQTTEGALRLRLISDLDTACREANDERRWLLAAMEAAEPGDVPDRIIERAEDASAVPARRCGGVTDETAIEDLRMRVHLVDQATEEMRALTAEFIP